MGVERGGERPTRAGLEVAEVEKRLTWDCVTACLRDPSS